MTTNATAAQRNETANRFELAKDATLRLPRAGALVRVESGTVLVTREGDQEDHVLERGDEIVVVRGGLAVAWAFTDAVLSIRTPAAARLPLAEPRRAA